MKVVVKIRGRKIAISARKLSFFGMFSGLMFGTRQCGNLLFDFHFYSRHAIHSLFVFYPFLVLWLDENDKVLEYKIVKPFTHLIAPRKKFIRMLEIPLTKENMKVFGFIVGKRKV